MRSIRVKIVLCILAIIIVVSIINILKHIEIKKDENEIIETTKYSIEKKLEELPLKTTEDYLEYLLEISKRVEPKELQKLVVVDTNIASVYKKSFFAQQENGEQVLRELIGDAYRELLCRVIRRGEDWSELPLTEHFREKFNESDGVLNDQYYSYDKGVYLNPGFNYDEGTVVTTCEDKEGNEYYGWYDFILDREGYLDDVVFNHREEIPWEPPYENNPYE